MLMSCPKGVLFRLTEQFRNSVMCKRLGSALLPQLCLVCVALQHHLHALLVTQLLWPREAVVVVG